MNQKSYLIVALVVLCVCFALIGYFNYDAIMSYIEGKEWQIADSFATVSLENVSQIQGGKSLAVLTNTSLMLYGSNAKSVYQEDFVTTGIVTDACEEYMVIAPKEGNQIYLFKGSELIWKKEFTGVIFNVSVNKNGYVTIIYSQTGRKSSIKVLKPSGDELFTTHLASTYAVDAEMTYDNKRLYIAELNADGIKIESYIKVIEMANIENTLSPKLENILVGSDEMVTDIELSNANELWIMKDTGIAKLDKTNTLQAVYPFERKNTLFASVQSAEAPVIVEKVSTGIFTSQTTLKIMKETSPIEVKVDKTPQSIAVMKDKIAFNMGDEVIFYRMDGNIEKRYELKNQLQTVELYDNGNVAALLFRDRIEWIKL